MPQVTTPFDPYGQQEPGQQQSGQQQPAVGPAFPPPGQPQFTPPPQPHVAPYDPYGAYGAQYSTAPSSNTDSKAILSLVLGVLSLPLAFCCMIGVVTGIAGVVLGGLALSEANKTGNTSSRGMAIGGIAVSVVAIVLSVGSMFLGIALNFAS